jgi:hypothetical protein
MGTRPADCAPPLPRSSGPWYLRAASNLEKKTAPGFSNKSDNRGGEVGGSMLDRLRRSAKVERTHNTGSVLNWHYRHGIRWRD